MESTKLSVLQDLCTAAVMADNAERAEIEEESADEIVRTAGLYAASLLGEGAANTLGTWEAVDPAVSPVDTGQASVAIARRARLVYSVDGDGDQSLALLTWCQSCNHHREARIGSLLALASALQQAGLR